MCPAGENSDEPIELMFHKPYWVWLDSYIWGKYAAMHRESWSPTVTVKST